jgi:hypothetical protein
MKKIVIIPGGFHPYHAGHRALYDAAREAFPSADVYVAATADTSNRPFPFEVKQKLARLAGIPAHRFIQVRSPFRAEEITQMYDPATTQLIFVRSEKDRDNQPRAGGVRRDGTPAYLQPYKRSGLQPMNTHGYIAYLPVVQFGPGMTSATEIRSKWPTMDQDQKLNLVKSIYPATADNDKLAGVVIQMLDAVIAPAEPAEPAVKEATVRNDPELGIVIAPTGTQQELPEGLLVRDVTRQLLEVVRSLRSGQYRNVEHLLYGAGGLENRIRALARYQDHEDRTKGRSIAPGATVDIGESDYIEEKLSELMPLR